MKTHKEFYRGIILWTFFFLLATTLPLLLTGILYQGSNRGFWVEFGVGLGFAGLSIFILQFFFTARYSRIKPSFGHDGLLYIHRQSGLIAWIFILGHFIILFIANPEYLSFLDPRVNAPRTFALSFVVVAIAILIISTLWRKNFGLKFEWWRLLHGLLALSIVAIGLAHTIMVNHYSSNPAIKVMWIVLTLLAVTSLVYMRIIRPYLIKKRPYKVTRVFKEVEKVWTVEIEPVGHNGMQFSAGQFAWLTLGDNVYDIQQHPFSFASAESDSKIQFTIKELGDYTNNIGEVEPGTTAYIEGPYGTFTLPDDSKKKIIFIVGGIGITPVISMLRTMQVNADKREIELLYGNKNEVTITFRDELEEMKKSLNIEVVHVLEEPSPEWDGEKGFIDERILQTYVITDNDDVCYFINGPTKMIEAIDDILKKWKVSPRRVITEYFEIV